MPVGEWNHARILSQGQHVEFWLNGEKTVEFERGSPEFRDAVAKSKFKNIPDFGEWADGHILLQEHGSEVSFRNVKHPRTAGKLELNRFCEALDKHEKSITSQFSQDRRRAAAVGLAVLPNIIPARLLGADAPGKKINVAQIGCGRMGRSDMGNVMTEPLGARGRGVRSGFQTPRRRQKNGGGFLSRRGESGVNVKTFHDYHEVLASPDIDAVVVTVPDHSHALVAIEAAIAGKHIYVQKPVTYDIVEAIGLRQAVEAKKIILQTGSQQRSEHPWGSFRKASEAVRNGRIGQLKTIKIGIGLDKPSGHPPAPMPVPENLDYERWLGSAPEQPYMEAPRASAEQPRTAGPAG